MEKTFESTDDQDLVDRFIGTHFYIIPNVEDQIKQMMQAMESMQTRLIMTEKALVEARAGTTPPPQKMAPFVDTRSIGKHRASAESTRIGTTGASSLLRTWARRTPGPFLR